MAASKKNGADSLERIIETATALFARHGYEGVSTRQLAAATGLNVATIHHHVGGKRELYLRVIEALFAREELLISGLTAELEDSELADRDALRKLLRRLIDRLVAMAASHPVRQQLYMRRWLEPPDDLTSREAELTLLLYGKLDRLLKRAQSLGSIHRGVDTGYFLRSFDWMLLGYFNSGAFNWQGLRGDPMKPAALRRFRAHLHAYTFAMLGLNEDATNGHRASTGTQTRNKNR